MGIKNGVNFLETTSKCYFIIGISVLQVPYKRIKVLKKCFRYEHYHWRYLETIFNMR